MYQEFLDRGFVAHLVDQTVYELDDSVAYAFLVHGRVHSYGNEIVMIGPCYIPAHMRILQFRVSGKFITPST